MIIHRRSRGLSGVDFNSNLVKGQRYTFLFTVPACINLDTNKAARLVAADSNFKSPAAVLQYKSFLGRILQVSFTYNGQGSTVRDAGGEMQKVLNSFGTTGVVTQIYFDSAEVDSPGVTATTPSNITNTSGRPDNNADEGDGGGRKPSSVSPVAIAFGIAVVTIAGVMALN